MKLVGKLKENVEKASSKEEAKKMIEEAGVSLSESELDAVTGGIGPAPRGIVPRKDKDPGPLTYEERPR